MERLTEKRFKNLGKGFYNFTSKERKELVNKSAPAYEELYRRLCELEDKLESGQLVELPCIREVKDYKGKKYEIYFNDNSDLAKGAIGHYTTRDKAQAEDRLKKLQEKL